jgi:hypothetical protein
MKKQTPQERIAIKKILKDEYGEDHPTFKKIIIIDECTRFTELDSGKVFTCIEVQLKGCLIENGIRRRYVSYADLENYEVSN